MADQAIYSPQRVLDENGEPVAGAKVTFYASGTLTLIDVWQDAAGSVASTNPVVADADGNLPQRFVGEAAKAVITDADDATLRTIDPVPVSLTSAGAAALVSFSPTVNIPAANAQAAIIMVDNNARAREAELGKPLRVDAAQSLSGPEQQQGRDNLGVAAAPTGTPNGQKVLRDDNQWTEKSWELINTFTPGAVTNVEMDLTGLRAAKITYDMCSPTVTATFRAELRGTVTGWSLANTLNGGVTAAQGVYGELLLYPWEETQLHVIRAAAATATVRAAPTSRTLTSIIFTAEWMTDQALDRLRLSWDTGNFDGGRILLHGVRG